MLLQKKEWRKDIQLRHTDRQTSARTRVYISCTKVSIKQCKPKYDVSRYQSQFGIGDVIFEICLPTSRLPFQTAKDKQLCHTDRHRQTGTHKRVYISCTNASIIYTGSLAPADFSGVVFNHAHFQKIAQISRLCDFYSCVFGY